MANIPTAEAIRAAITAHYLSTGEPLRRDAIHLHASFANAPTTAYAVRKVLDAHGGAVPGTTWEEVEVERRSRSYPTMGAIGHTKAVAFLPSLEHLRTVIRDLLAVNP